ncbi:MAG: 3-oxoacyl-ACP reductase [Deltaproteobacteria bacterium]|nr:3-oxoacyl-ACP reductase [Deltaproteobacteria bacterium]
MVRMSPNSHGASGTGGVPGMSGRVALVTGAASGIGRAAARVFARDGARVVVADLQRAAAEGQETVRLIQEAGGTGMFVPTDVARVPDVEALVGATIAAYGRLDYALNNAGVCGTPTGVVGCSRAQWDEIIAINLTGTWLCLKHEIPEMVKSGGGAIVNTASGAGLLGVAGMPAYVASKHGIIGLTKSAALEFASQKIRVNAICPGTTWTPMMETLIEGSVEMENMLRAASPYGRMARPEEVAEAAVWLCSGAASFVNGVALPVDAGRVAG